MGVPSGLERKNDASCQELVYAILKDASVQQDVTNQYDLLRQSSVGLVV